MSKHQAVDNEVQKLLKEGRGHLSQKDMLRLRDKYNDDDLLEQIHDAFLEKQDEIRKQAKKFYKLIVEKYGGSNYPLHLLLKKAYKYKKKYELSDAEFEEFKRLYEQHLSGVERTSRTVVHIPKTNLGKALGHVALEQGAGLKVASEDYATVQEIIKSYAQTRTTHAQVVLQSMTYTGLSHEALTGEYDKKRNNPHCHIHPVVAALFLHKIPLLDDHMLMANIAYIVKARHNREPIMTKPDYELFYDLVSDPTDIVCDNDSPVRDLAKRAALQQNLWHSVLSLRNGRYYDCSTTEFLVAVDNCKFVNYDEPNLMYVSDEATILRRLLGAFSLRPTVVATTPLYGMVAGAPFQQRVVVPRVTSMPMITLRLPPYNVNTGVQVSLTDALDQSQWFLENGTVVPKSQKIIYSKGLMIFYVPRRTSMVDISNVTEPYNFNRLPISIAGFERINDRPVEVDSVITINDDQYELASAVIVDVNPQQQNIIIGSSAVVMTHASVNSSPMENAAYHYDPRNAAHAVELPGNNFQYNNPITQIPVYPSVATNVESFMEMARTRGTIFVYTLRGTGRAPDMRYMWM